MLGQIKGEKLAAMVKHMIDDISTEDPEAVFELQEKLGKGSYGMVYKGRNRTSNETLAVKILALDDEATLKVLLKKRIGSSSAPPPRGSFAS
jgi:serine/threonine protein kinase